MYNRNRKPYLRMRLDATATADIHILRMRTLATKNQKAPDIVVDITESVMRQTKGKKIILKIQPDGNGVYYEIDEEEAISSTKQVWDYAHLAKGEPLPFPPKSENAQLLLF